MSCWSAIWAGAAGGAGWGGRAGWAQLAGAGGAAARIKLFRDFIEHLDHVVEVGLLDLRRARLAGTRDVDVVAGLREGRPIFFLPFVEFHDHRHRRLVESGFGGR